MILKSTAAKKPASEGDNPVIIRSHTSGNASPRKTRNVENAARRYTACTPNTSAPRAIISEQTSVRKPEEPPKTH